MTDLVAIKKLATQLSVIYVEDEELIRNTLSKYLSKLFQKVDTASNGEEAIELYKKNHYDIVITDINMPKIDGLEMAKRIKEIEEDQNILIISAYSEAKYFTNFIHLGIDGYILKPIDYDQLNSLLYKTCFKITQFQENKLYRQQLEELVEKKTHDIQNLQKEKILNYEKTLYAMVKMIEDRDTYTGGHSMRVAHYSKLIAQKMGFSEKQLEAIYKAGILHDIGKIAIPDNILLKPGSLESLEYSIIQEHVNMGVKILKKIPMFSELSLFIQHHHERLDGSGYPLGVKGDQIPIESQILAVADSFDAMTTNRIYKARKTTQAALNEIKGLADIHYKEKITLAAYDALKDIIIDETISQFPTNALEKERFSYFYKDQITQAYNDKYLDLILLQSKTSDQYNFAYIYQVMLHNLNEYNIKHGWQEGNTLLKAIFEKLKEHYKTDYIFRIYGDDFIILSENKLQIDHKSLTSLIDNEQLNFELKIYNIIEDKITEAKDISKI